MPLRKDLYERTHYGIKEKPFKEGQKLETAKLKLPTHTFTCHTVAKISVLAFTKKGTFSVYTVGSFRAASSI